jgi:hypothetical protein
MYVNIKIIPVETFPGMGGEGIKERGGEGKFNYDIFDTILRTFLNATMYPHPVQQ